MGSCGRERPRWGGKEEQRGGGEERSGEEEEESSSEEEGGGDDEEEEREKGGGDDSEEVERRRGAGREKGGRPREGEEDDQSCCEDKGEQPGAVNDDEQEREIQLEKAGESMTTPRRVPWDPIILTTLPHFAAAWMVIDCQDAWLVTYGIVMFVSSCLSVLWHMSGESTGILLQLDYLFALFWTVGDISQALRWLSPEQVADVVLATIGTLILNKLADRVQAYHLAHSMWHLVNVAKSVFVASMIAQEAKCHDQSLT